MKVDVHLEGMKHTIFKETPDWNYWTEKWIARDCVFRSAVVEWKKKFVFNVEKTSNWKKSENAVRKPKI